jgi:hypothetical protein
LDHREFDGESMRSVVILDSLKRQCNTAKVLGHGRHLGLPRAGLWGSGQARDVSETADKGPLVGLDPQNQTPYSPDVTKLIATRANVQSLPKKQVSCTPLGHWLFGGFYLRPSFAVELCMDCTLRFIS